MEPWIWAAVAVLVRKPVKCTMLFQNRSFYNTLYLLGTIVVLLLLLLLLLLLPGVNHWGSHRKHRLLHNIFVFRHIKCYSNSYLGVGGVILVPVMLELNVNVKTAVASSMASYIAAGLVGTISYLRINSLEKSAVWFGLGATPGALVGSYCIHRMRDSDLTICTYILIFISALFTLVRMLLDYHSSNSGNQGRGQKVGDPCKGVPPAPMALKAYRVDNGKMPCTSSPATTKPHHDSKAQHKNNITSNTVNKKRNSALEGNSIISTSAQDEGAVEAAASTGMSTQRVSSLMHSEPTVIIEEADSKSMVNNGSDLLGEGGKGNSSSFNTVFTQWKRIFMGIFVGFGSALTGTSGPVIILPILFLTENMPPLTALGIAQSVQIPIATFATIGNVVFGQNTLNVYLALLLAGGLAIFVPVGSYIAHIVPRNLLKAIVNVALLIAASSLIVRIAIRSS